MRALAKENKKKETAKQTNRGRERIRRAIANPTTADHLNCKLGCESARKRATGGGGCFGGKLS